ncbi:coiled-coil domain-containing protein 22 [Cuculus canorus]|uniref:coiled-coil domain-containing protein 22 n=1 Tax=Cuculus canorus TaxID=55661 RepID=UPI0023AA9B9D|nr:coiled-coil domain-containing protein 22 [Cuculus canorus]
MEEVDKILIHSLRQAGTPVPPEIQSVGDFSAELVVEAAVRCIRWVRPDLGAPLNPVLPPAISARFRLASDLAAACQELGFRGDVGYQTFLYSSERDTRRLLLFLAEKLPRDEAERGAQPPGKPGALLSAIGSRIRELLGTPWVPPQCRPPRLQRLQGNGYLYPFVSCPLVLPQSGGPPELQSYFGGSAPPVPAQTPKTGGVAPAFLETHAAQLSVRPTEFGGSGSAPRLTPSRYLRGIHSVCGLGFWNPFGSSAPPPLPRGPPKVPPSILCGSERLLGGPGPRNGGALPKGSRFTRTQHLTRQPAPQVLQLQVAAEPHPPPGASEEDAAALRAREVAALEEALAALEAEIGACRAGLRDAQLGLAQAEAEAQEGRRALGGREEALRLRTTALELLPEAPQNLHKLQLVVEASSRRLLSLAGQWERHRQPLLDEFRHLRALRDSAQLESSRRLSELLDLHERSRAAANDARRKEDLYRQLVAELEALPRDASRAVYTQRIHEIVGNIRKQKEEIGKILVDTRALQKEINALGGKLERTFSVTDELLFKDAKRDESVRKAYKHLAALHENCAQLIQTIEDTGTIQREIRDLEEQVG